MSETVRKRLWSSRLAAASGVFIAALGLMVLIGWFSHSTSLIQLRPDLPPMTRNAAACFLLCGLALLTIVLKGPKWIVVTCAGIVSASSVLTIGEYVFRVNAGIDELLGPSYLVLRVSSPGRMAPVVAISFALGSIGLLLGPNRLAKRAGLLLGLTGSMIAAAGIGTSLAVVMGSSDAPEWSDVMHVALHTAIGLWVFGFGVLALAWHLEADQAGTPSWLPISVSLGVATSTLALWQALIADRYPPFAPIPAAILVGGCLMAPLLGLTIYLAQRAHTSERNLSMTIDTIPTFIQVSRSDGSVLSVNQAVLDYYGVTLEDMQKEDFRSRVYHPDDVERLSEERKEALKRPVTFEYEQRALGKDGKYRWFLVRYNPLLDDQGRIERWYATAFDIEDRKRAEDALVRQAGVRADVSAAFSQPIDLADILRGCTKAIVRHFDAAFARIWTLSKDKSMLELQASAGMYTRLDGSYSRIPFGDLKVGWIAREKKAHLTNDVMNDPRVHNKDWAKDNGIVAFAGYPLIVEDRLIGVVGLFARRTLSESILDTLASVADTIAQGIERKRAEQALRNALDEVKKSESKLRQVIDAIPALAWCNLPDGPNEFLNKGWHEYTGLSEEESHGWGWQAAFHPEDLPPLMEKWIRMLAAGVPDEIEARLRRHDGVYRWFLIRAEPFRDESGKIVRWYGTSTDIDDRKRAEEESRRSEAFLAEAQHLSRIGSFSWRVATDEITWSEPLYRVYDLDPATTITLDVIRTRVHPDDLTLYEKMVEQARNGSDDFEWQYRLLMPDQSIKYLHAVARATRNRDGELEYIAAVQDVTRRRLSQEALDKARSELARVARMMSLGALTASIAHEVNQPLSGIITNASTCVRMLDADPPNVDGARETAKRTIRDGRRAADVITRLRALFGRKEAATELVDLNEATLEVIALSRSELERNNVITRTELTDELPMVTGDRVQLQQVIINLLRNGSDAMTSVDDRPRELLFKTELDEGDCVRLSVRDAGTGFDPQTLDQLFRSFYTTKADGMGIGLSVSRSIIENHRGRLWATPNDGPGVTFSFSLPWAKDS